MDPIAERRKEALEIALRRQQVSAEKMSVDALIGEAAKIDKFLDGGEAAGERK